MNKKKLSQENKKMIMWIGVVLTGIVIFVSWLYFFKFSLTKQLNSTENKKQDQSWVQIKNKTEEAFSRFKNNWGLFKKNIDDNFVATETENKLSDELKANVLKEIEKKQKEEELEGALREAIKNSKEEIEKSKSQSSNAKSMPN